MIIIFQCIFYQFLINRRHFRVAELYIIVVSNKKVLFSLGKLQSFADSILRNLNLTILFDLKSMNLINCQLEFDSAFDFSSEDKYLEAIQHYGRALNQNPRHFPSLINRGTIYSLLKLWPLAEEDFNLAVSIDPSDPTGYYNRFVVCASNKKYKQALADLYCSLSCLNVQKGAAMLSLRHFSRALELIETNHFAYIQRAEFYRSAGDDRLALKDLNVALEIDPTNRRALCLRCLAFKSLGDFQKASKDHELALYLATSRIAESATLQVRFPEMNDKEILREIQIKLAEVKELRKQQSLQRSVSEPRFLKCKSSISLSKGIIDSTEYIKPDSRLTTEQNLQPSLNAKFTQLLANRIGLIGGIIITPPQDEQPPTLKPSPSGAELRLTERSEYQKKDSLESEKSVTARSLYGGKRGSEIKKLAQLISEDEDYGINRSMSQLPLAPLNPILLEQSISSRHCNTMSQKVIKPIQKKRIEIEIIAATLTHNTELFGNMSPYCSLIYENEVRTTKVASRAGKNPVWNESFSFAIKDSNLLKIQVWDKELIKKDDFVGVGSSCIYEAVNKIQLKHENTPAGIVFIKMKLT